MVWAREISPKPLEKFLLEFSKKCLGNSLRNPCPEEITEKISGGVSEGIPVSQRNLWKK